MIELRTASDRPVEAVGRKAHNLAVLAAAGFPVPEGAVLPSPWVESVSDAELREALGHLLTRLSPPFAVRSSAVAEDTADRSFAGLYETVLSVEELDGLVEAVRTVAASGTAERVTEYAGGVGGVAVLIQEMVAADSAGVCFTADPISGERDVVVVNSVSGLGERLVSGEADADEWEVRGGAVGVRRAPESSLDEDQVRAVADLATEVARHFGAPQDIEWAITGDDLYLLQSRPITGLPEVEPIRPDIEPPSEGFWALDASHYPAPMSPMAASFYLPALEEASSAAFRDWGFLVDRIEDRAIGWRVYLRVVPTVGSEGGPTPPWWLLGMLSRIVPSMRRQARRARKAFEQDRIEKVTRRWWDEWRPTLETRIRRLEAVDLSSLGDEALLDHLDTTLDLVRTGQRIHFELFPPHMVSVAELVEFCVERLGWTKAEATDLLSGLSSMSTEPARRLHAMAGAARSRPAISGLIEDDDVTLDELRAADRAFADELDDYLDEFGIRATAYDVLAPTIGEQDHLVLSAIRSEFDYDPGAIARRQAERREQRMAEARAALPGDEEALARFEALVERVTEVYPVREDNVFFTDNAPIGLVRLSALEIGRRIADRGLIAEPGHVFFLGIHEARQSLEEGVERHEVVQRRRGEREWALRNPAPPAYGDEPGPMPDMRAMPEGIRRLMSALEFFITGDLDTSSGDGLTGTPASAGTYTGPARVILSEDQFDRVRPGDVLVCPITTPAWSVLFGRIGGLVTDTGGLLSHSAIVAREHGIPAAVGTGSATRQIEDGQRITVDGTTGRVEIRG